MFCFELCTNIRMEEYMCSIEDLYNNLLTQRELLKIDHRNLIIWGMGPVSTLYINAFSLNKIDVYAFTGDDWKEKKGEYQGVKVISPDEIKQVDNPLVLICVRKKTTKDEIVNSFSEEIESIGIDEYFFMKYAEELRDNYYAFDEDSSRKLYLELIQKRIEFDSNMLELFTPNPYFAIEQMRETNSNEVFVDMGAYVGDTLEQYLFMKSGFFNKYYAFEPDEGNFKAMNYRIERLCREWNFSNNKIIPVYAGVGEKTTEGFFSESDNNHLSSHICDSCDEGAIRTQIYSIDDYFKEIQVSFLKADIESYELYMLKGAKKVIERDQPKLAVTIYHNGSDMIKIMSFLRNLNVDYQFRIRHHSTITDETVLYAFASTSKSVYKK